MDGTWVSTNATGDVTGFVGYDAFGSLSFGTPIGPFGFAGQYSDGPTGLSDLRARLYDPTSGSFTTRDPAFAQTDTAYSYGGDDPVNAVDPLGLCSSGPMFLFAGTCDISAARSRALGAQFHSEESSGFSWSAGWDSMADFFASAANGVVSTLTFGLIQISDPYCNVPGWVKVAGNVFGDVVGGVALGVVGGVVLDGAVSAASWATDAFLGGSEVTETGASVAEGAEEGFNSLIRVAEEPRVVYRVYGRDAGPWGSSWTPENPLEMDSPRAKLGLPKGNTGQFLTKATVLDTGGVISRTALPLDGNPGGAEEWLFPDAQSQLSEIWTILLEPPI